MGIQALPQTAVRAIGASQVLTDPAAVVKELIDNALDAHATSIAVEISNNTLDIIQVRDNGPGISPEDRAMVARRYCTSKISGEEDLKSIAGSSLGFRGEALASAAEMSGSLFISTRVESEPVATSLKISQQGEVMSQERASLPIGTTVKLCDFIKTNPVRRQVALKNTEKCLKKVKQTMQKYALARPQTRLSLRVLKTKNEKGNFMYAPQPNDNRAQNAAPRVFGSSCTSQCSWHVASHEGFMMQTFLPKPNANPGKVGNVGAFVSVDGRPISSSRGIAKQLVKIFRDALKKANNQFDGVKDPFLYLEINCAAGSYDANIEPAKDDVLFEDADAVVACARELFAVAYPQAEQVPPIEVTSIASPIRPSNRDISDEVAVRAPEQAQTPRPTSEISRAISNAPVVPSMVESAESPAETQRAFRPNMYGSEDEDLDGLDTRPSRDRDAADMEELRLAKKDVTASNPWVMARLNASVSRPGPSYEAAAMPSSDNMAPSSSPVRTVSDKPVPAVSLPTPWPSSPPLSHTAFHPWDHVPGHRYAQDGRLIGANTLPLTVTPHQQSPTQLETPTGDSGLQSRPAYNYDLASSSNPGLGTSLEGIPAAQAKPRLSQPKRNAPALVNKPFVSPTTVGPRERAWSDHLEGIERSSRPFKTHAPAHGLVQQGESEDDSTPTPAQHNRDIRDWIGSTESVVEGSAPDHVDHPDLRRRRSARRPITEDNITLNNEASEQPRDMLRGRGFVPASELVELQARAGTCNGPAALLKRRKTGNSRPLRQICGNVIDVADEGYLPENEKERAPHRRRTTEGDATYPGRRKSSRLPLEHVPTKKRTQNLILNCDQKVGQTALAVSARNSSGIAWNQPAIGAHSAFSQSLRASELDEMTIRLRALLATKRPGEEPIHDLRRRLSDALMAMNSVVVASGKE